jgi:hypothetical protein
MNQVGVFLKQRGKGPQRFAKKKQEPESQVLKLHTWLDGRQKSQVFKPEAQAKDDSRKLMGL